MAARKRGTAIAMQMLRGALQNNTPCLKPHFDSPCCFRQINDPLRRVPYLAPMPWTRVRYLCCCAGLGTPPPREIIVEYCEAAGYTDYFINFADAIENAYPEFVVLGNPDGLQPRKGSFEVKTGDTILFSKLKTNRLPMLKDILSTLDALSPSCHEVA